MKETLDWIAAFVLAAVFVIGGILAATPAAAQMACGVRDSIVAQLSDKYGETRRGRGLAKPMAIFEIWASEATGTWTILKTTPNGLTCIMAVGNNWQDETIPIRDPT